MLKRITLRVVLIIVALAPSSRAREAKLRDGDLVAICGDSITEQKLYSVFIEDYLLMCQPQPNLRAMQFGWNGEQAFGFDHRVINDVIRFKPSVVTTCYGMNDGGYAPLTPERAQQYRDSMIDVVKKLKQGGVRLIVVGSPGCVDADKFGDSARAVAYNTTLAQLRDIAREVAREQGVAFADVHSTMIDVMTKAKAKYGHDYHVAGNDGVHPWPNGQLAMAYAFLKAIGCDGEIGTISIDFATGKADASAGHRILSSDAGRALEIESTRYPFCFTGDPASPEATSGVIEFMPFNGELNRFRLIVRHAGAPRVKVTWGRASKEFSSEQLEQGINLVAEFIDNPFSAAFAETDAAIRKQQEFETPMIKQVLHVTDLLPEESETVEKLMSSARKRDDGLFDAARASVRPVRHRITIEPVK